MLMGQYANFKKPEILTLFETWLARERLRNAC